MKEETENAPPDPLVSAASRGDWEEMESLWLERLEEEAPAASPFLDGARALGRCGETERLKVLASMTAPALLASGSPEAVIELAREASSASIDDPDLVEAMLGAFRTARGDHTACGKLVDRADLERGRGLAHVLETLDHFFRFDQGDLVRHAGGWGFGDVEKIVPRREEIHVHFESGRTHIFPMRTAGEYLERLPGDRIENLARRDPEALAAEVHSDPLRVVARAVEGAGGTVDGKDLKALLVPRAIPEEEWIGWWGRLREKLRQDPFYEIGAGANPQITRRSTPRTFSDAAASRFQKAGGFWDKLDVLRRYVKKVKRREAEASLLQDSFASLARRASSLGAGIALHFLHEDLTALSSAVPAPGFPAALDPDDLGSVLEEIEVTDYRLRLLDEVRGRFPDRWPGAFEALLFRVADPRILEEAVGALMKGGHGDRIASRIPDLLADHVGRPWPFLWFSKAALEGKLAGLSCLPGPTDLADMLLDIVHGASTFRIAEGREAKRILAKARATLDREALQKAFDGVSEAVAKRLWHRIRTEGLSQTTVSRAEVIVAGAYPSIIAAEKEKDGASGEEQVLWTTAEALKKRRREYDRLINEEFPRNAEALGKAIAMGDLSENAEYDAAREEQGRLTERAKKMEEELRIARVIDPARAAEDIVRVGSAVKVEEKGGGTSEFHILGPWDAEPDNGVISYLSPLGQGLVGKKVGETVRVPLPEGERELTVLGVEPAPELRKTS